MTVRVRMADWRDRDAVEGLRKALRETLNRPDDTGLYELLRWSVYHVLLAVVGDRATGERPVGFSAVLLLPGGVADELGTFVDPASRRHGCSGSLRATQVRNLLLMGWTRLWVTVPATPEALAWSQAQFGDDASICLPDGTRYLGDDCEAIRLRLLQQSHEPYPLSPALTEQIRRRGDRAREQLLRVAAQGAVSLAKARCRELVAVHG